MNSKNSLKTYFLFCKKFTDNNNPETVKIKGRLMMKSICSVCGNKKSGFILQGSGLLDSRVERSSKYNQKCFVECF